MTKLTSVVAQGGRMLYMESNEQKKRYNWEGNFFFK